MVANASVSKKGGSALRSIADPRGVSLLFDATVYIDQLKDDLPMPVVDLVASRTILHGAPALAELAVTIGTLKPNDRRTPATLIPIVEMLTRINPARIVAPNYQIWLEAAVIAGILARTQSIPKQDRRKFLSDTLLFLQAADAEAVMVSRNSRDLDLLLQIKPQVVCCSLRQRLTQKVDRAHMGFQVQLLDQLCAFKLRPTPTMSERPAQSLL
jgi:hypothetical protein